MSRFDREIRQLLNRRRLAAERETATELQRRTMDLETALRILATVHTADDEEIGFVVRMAATPRGLVAEGDYIEAWRVLRECLGAPT